MSLPYAANAMRRRQSVETNEKRKPSVVGSNPVSDLTIPIPFLSFSHQWFDQPAKTRERLGSAAVIDLLAASKRNRRDQSSSSIKAS